MAGIGFELKKLFKKEGVFNNVKAAAYSTLVTIGPTVTCVFMMMLFNFILKQTSASFVQRELMQVTIMYSFAFSLIITSGYSMVLTRYIADKIYEENYEDIKASLYGSLMVIVVIGAIAGVGFYTYAKLDLIYKIAAYILFMELLIQCILSTYISALKDSAKIVYAFVTGMAVATVIGIILIFFTRIDSVLSTIIAFDLGVLLIILNLYLQINNYFKGMSDKYFHFLKYFKNYYILFFVNTFFTLGLYVHSMIFWFNKSSGKIICDTYFYAPSYDIPTFFAILTIMPTMVIFVVKVETSFFEKYRDYFYLINNGACYKDIEISKVEMQTVMFREIISIMVIQLICSISAIELGRIFLRLAGFTHNMIATFNLLVLGYYGVVILFVVVTILLYFDDRKGAFFVNLIFLLSNIIFTAITAFYGEIYYGFGMFLSGVISISAAVFRLSMFIKNIDYYVFCKNAYWKN